MRSLTKLSVSDEINTTSFEEFFVVNKPADENSGYYSLIDGFKIKTTPAKLRMEVAEYIQTNWDKPFPEDNFFTLGEFAGYFDKNKGNNKEVILNYIRGNGIMGKLEISILAKIYGRSVTLVSGEGLRLTYGQNYSDVYLMDTAGGYHFDLLIKKTEWDNFIDPKFTDRKRGFLLSEELAVKRSTDELTEIKSFLDEKKVSIHLNADNNKKIDEIMRVIDDFFVNKKITNENIYNEISGFLKGKRSVLNVLVIHAKIDYFLILLNETIVNRNQHDSNKVSGTNMIYILTPMYEAVQANKRNYALLNKFIKFLIVQNIDFNFETIKEVDSITDDAKEISKRLAQIKAFVDGLNHKLWDETKQRQSKKNFREFLNEFSLEEKVDTENANLNKMEMIERINKMESFIVRLKRFFYKQGEEKAGEIDVDSQKEIDPGDLKINEVGINYFLYTFQEEVKGIKRKHEINSYESFIANGISGLKITDRGITSDIERNEIVKLNDKILDIGKQMKKDSDLISNTRKHLNSVLGFISREGLQYENIYNEILDVLSNENITENQLADLAVKTNEYVKELNEKVIQYDQIKALSGLHTYLLGLMDLIQKEFVFEKKDSISFNGLAKNLLSWLEKTNMTSTDIYMHIMKNAKNSMRFIFDVYILFTVLNEVLNNYSYEKGQLFLTAINIRANYIYKELKNRISVISLNDNNLTTANYNRSQLPNFFRLMGLENNEIYERALFAEFYAPKDVFNFVSESEVFLKQLLDSPKEVLDLPASGTIHFLRDMRIESQKIRSDEEKRIQAEDGVDMRVHRELAEVNFLAASTHNYLVGISKFNPDPDFAVNKNHYDQNTEYREMDKAVSQNQMHFFSAKPELQLPAEEQTKEEELVVPEQNKYISKLTNIKGKKEINDVNEEKQPIISILKTDNEFGKQKQDELKISNEKRNALRRNKEMYDNDEKQLSERKQKQNQSEESKQNKTGTLFKTDTSSASILLSDSSLVGTRDRLGDLEVCCRHSKIYIPKREFFDSDLIKWAFENQIKKKGVYVDFISFQSECIKRLWNSNYIDKADDEKNYIYNDLYRRYVEINDRLISFKNEFIQLNQSIKTDMKQRVLKLKQEIRALFEFGEQSMLIRNYLEDTFHHFDYNGKLFRLTCDLYKIKNDGFILINELINGNSKKLDELKNEYPESEITIVSTLAFNIDDFYVAYFKGTEKLNELKNNFSSKVGAVISKLEDEKEKQNTKFEDMKQRIRVLKADNEELRYKNIIDEAIIFDNQTLQRLGKNTSVYSFYLLTENFNLTTRISEFILTRKEKRKEIQNEESKYITEGVIQLLNDHDTIIVSTQNVAMKKEEEFKNKIKEYIVIDSESKVKQTIIKIIHAFTMFFQRKKEQEIKIRDVFKNNNVGAEKNLRCENEKIFMACYDAIQAEGTFLEINRELKKANDLNKTLDEQAFAFVTNTVLKLNKFSDDVYLYWFKNSVNEEKVDEIKKYFDGLKQQNKIDVEWNEFLAETKSFVDKIRKIKKNAQSDVDENIESLKSFSGVDFDNEVARKLQIIKLKNKKRLEEILKWGIESALFKVIKSEVDDEATFNFRAFNIFHENLIKKIESLQMEIDIIKSGPFLMDQ